MNMDWQQKIQTAICNFLGWFTKIENCFIAIRCRQKFKYYFDVPPHEKHIFSYKFPFWSRIIAGYITIPYYQISDPKFHHLTISNGMILESIVPVNMAGRYKIYDVIYASLFDTSTESVMQVELPLQKLISSNISRYEPISVPVFALLPYFLHTVLPSSFKLDRETPLQLMVIHKDEQGRTNTDFITMKDAIVFGSFM